MKEQTFYIFSSEVKKRPRINFIIYIWTTKFSVMTFTTAHRTNHIIHLEIQKAHWNNNNKIKEFRSARERCKNIEKEIQIPQLKRLISHITTVLCVACVSWINSDSFLYWWDYCFLQVTISNGKTFQNHSGIMFNQISGYSQRLSSWDTKWKM